MLDGSKSSIEISIHALLAESDAVNDRDNVRCHSQFLSTLSLRRATKVKKGENNNEHISIHALLAESDFADGL